MTITTINTAALRTVTVQVRDAEGILERILMTTRRRGFRLYGCTVHLAAALSHYDIILQVESERPLAFLMLQLQKLVDVVSVGETAGERHARRA